MGAWLVAAFLPMIIIVVAAVFLLELPTAVFWMLIAGAAIVFAYRRGRDDVLR